MIKNLTRALALTIACGTATTAFADPFAWEFKAGITPGATNNNGGIIERISSVFDPDSNAFYWSVVFGDQVTRGFTLAISPGANPKGHAGELALLYFDATNLADPKLSVYAYNGQNSASTYFDGSPAAGTQSPDAVQGTVSPLKRLTADLSVVDSGGKRTMTMAFNAGFINAHTPIYPPPGNPGNNEWTGVEFGPQIGVWFHPYKNLSTSYNNDGFLTSWSGSEGWLDGSDWPTTTIPAPGAAAMLGLGGLIMSRRRRA